MTSGLTLGINITTEKKSVIPIESPLTHIFILDGIRDIVQDKNQYGVARSLLKTILSYRVYNRVYDEIRAGFLPNESANYTLGKALKNAIKGNHKHLVKYFIDKAGCKIDMYGSIRTAVQYGYMELVEYMKEIYQSYYPWNKSTWSLAVLEGLARINRSDLFTIETDMLKYICHGAARGGHLDLLEEHYIHTGDHYEVWRQAARGGHYHILSYLSKGTIPDNPWKMAMLEASRGGHTKLIHHCIKHIGEDSINQECLNEAIKGGHVDIVDWFISKLNMTSANYRFALRTAMEYQRNNLILLFSKKLGFRTFAPSERDYLIF